MTAAEILRQLVAIPTPSATSNLPLIEWVRAFIEPQGWQAELHPYTDGNGIAKANLIARPAGTAQSAVIDLAFICHTDTVPYAPNWSDALRLRSVDGNLHGCGACDVKGALACFLAALNSLSPTGLHPSIAMILTADEEIGCKGMEHLLATAGLRIHSAIVSEPTSLRPGIAGKGYGLARVTVRGAEAHSAYPAEGASAIVVAARFITRLDELTGPSTSDNHRAVPEELFDPPRTTVNVGVIEGGSAKNIIAGQCSFLVEWRPIPADLPTAMLALLQSLAAELMHAHPRTAIHIEALRAEPGFAPVLAGPLQQRLQGIAARSGAPRRAPAGISFGSEASRLAKIADEVIVIGPGDMHTAHSDRECVPIAELDEWTGTLRKLISAPLQPEEELL